MAKKSTPVDAGKYTAVKRGKAEIIAHFPLSSNPGGSLEGINGQTMHDLAKAGKPVSSEEWSSIIKAHEQFLASGGAGGHWETLLLSDGLVIGVYVGAEGKQGKQADLSFLNLAKGLPFAGLKLLYANLAGIIAENIDFGGANLTGCLVTDSLLSEASFKESILRSADFSRSIMHSCNFRGANLAGADFEHSDLAGSDFTNAILDNARFPGAILDDVKF
nr:pentapeptide repeat-containing protein [Candidatus Sigynarchaeota archaeon]